MRGPRSPRPLAGLAAACALVPLLGAAPAAAQQSTITDLRGTWKVQSTAIVTGEGKHHPGGAPAAQAGNARLRDFTGTLRIAGQEGERFWGTFESAAHREDVTGILTGEGGRFLAVDADGFYEGSVAEPGRLRYCYRHLSSTSRVVCCGTGTRE